MPHMHSVSIIPDLVPAWEALCADPMFKDCAHKVELTATGKIIMSPASNKHGFLQTRISHLLGELTSGGETGTEIAIQTVSGVYVADVVWCTTGTFSDILKESAASRAPEICVEIMNSSNTLSEMEQKRDQYFERGCQEFFLIDRKGFVTIQPPDGQRSESILAPGFPDRIVLGE